EKAVHMACEGRLSKSFLCAYEAQAPEQYPGLETLNLELQALRSQLSPWLAQEVSSVFPRGRGRFTISSARQGTTLFLYSFSAKLAPGRNSWPRVFTIRVDG